MTTTSPKPKRTTPTPIASSSLARGPSARAAASPRFSTFNVPTSRRPPTKSTSPTPLNGDVHESLSASLKHETDQKEQLLLQLQDKDQLITNYVTESNNLTSALTSAESRLNEFYAEQSRWELELAQRIDISERLRDQVREQEKEKRDLQRRYNEQIATFDAERQAFYDNEQHLKSRIQSLTQARKRANSIALSIEKYSDDVPDEQDFSAPDIPNADQLTQEQSKKSHQDFGDPECEPAEMTALRLELSTLSTSYASLQSTLILMQSQLVDLKRVNRELQEENESYMILLREKTLNGQFDVMKQVGVSDSEDGDEGFTDADSMRSLGRSTLERVDEESPELIASELPIDYTEDVTPSSRATRGERKRSASSGARRGESLADLPITGPGLDLAAELGRAANKDILVEGNLDERSAPAGKNKRHKKGVPTHIENPTSENAPSSDLDALRSEVKSLKDANKALSLYASKIIDRIIAQEGFEHVLAVDYDKEPPTPSTAVPRNDNPQALLSSQPRPRPQSVIIGHSTSSPNPTADPKPATIPTRPSAKSQRRSLSFDWKGFSIFSDKKSDPSPNLRPLTLKPGSASVTSARKLDTFEDEEDRRERERLHATMKLMGIQPSSQSSMLPPIPTVERTNSAPSIPTSKSNRRFSFFGSSTPVENVETSSSYSEPSVDPVNSNSDVELGLTQEILEQVEAQHSLAALDARERDLSAEIAKGSSGGFTEIATRSSKRGRRSLSKSGSGSTVWSAGMSGHGDD